MTLRLVCLAGFPHLLLIAFPEVSFGVAIPVATSSDANRLIWSSLYQNMQQFAGQVLVLAELVS